MGFWDSVGNAAKGAIDTIERNNADAEELIGRYQREDDDFLKEKLRSGNYAQKIAATKLLKERGYGSN
ncbi:MAG: hypothetical protein WCL34_04450 [Methylococcaceae bacterium]